MYRRRFYFAHDYVSLVADATGHKRGESMMDRSEFNRLGNQHLSGVERGPFAKKKIHERFLNLVWGKNGRSQIAKILSDEFRLRITPSMVSGTRERLKCYFKNAGVEWPFSKVNGEGESHGRSRQNLAAVLTVGSKLPQLVKPDEEEIKPQTGDGGEFVTLLTINDRMCRWPIGDPAESGFHFCGKKREKDSSYCEGHARKAYKQREPRLRAKRVGAVVMTTNFR